MINNNNNNNNNLTPYLLIVTNAYEILIRKPEGKRLLGRPTSRCEDNIQIDLKED
jgi:hypothetical protein